VLETTVPHVIPHAASIGALIAFRAIYFVLPPILGTGLLFICEFIPGHSRVRKESQPGRAAHASSV
jgi:glycosyltransferase 2 family protein